MEQLALTSKVLYDNEILKVKKELYELRKKYETPKVMFENWQDWEKAKSNIKTELWEFIVENDVRFFYMSYSLEVMHGTGIERKIEQLLEELTGNHEWSCGKGYEIIDGINDAIDSIEGWCDEDGVPLYEQANDIQRHIIHSIICKRLGVVDDIPNERLLCYIPQFICKNCNSVVDMYISEVSNICGDCENKL